MTDERTVEQVSADVHDYLTSIGPGEHPDEDAVAEFARQFAEAHARTVSVLTKCLREAVIEMCHACPSCGTYPSYVCKNAESGCFVKEWRRVLGDTGEKGLSS